MTSTEVGSKIIFRVTDCLVKECGMGPQLVFVSPCFRENVVVTCKIGSFLCSLDTSEKCNCFLFWKSSFKSLLYFAKQNEMDF